MPSSTWLLPLLALIAAYLYSSPPEVLRGEKQTRSPLSRVTQPITISTLANKAYFTNANYAFNFTTPQSSEYAVQLQVNGTTQLDITNSASCQMMSNTTSGVSYNCQYQIPGYSSTQAWYNVAVSVPASSWSVAGKTFAITSQFGFSEPTVTNSEVMTLSGSYSGYSSIYYYISAYDPTTVDCVDVTTSPMFAAATNVTAPSGSFSTLWTVPVTLAPAVNGYQAWIWGNSSTSSALVLLGVSSPFSVQDQAATLSSMYSGQNMTVNFPSSGDMWRTSTNDSVSFTWTPASTTYSSFQVDIYSASPGGSFYYNPFRVLKNGDATKHSFTFLVPPAIPQGNYFLYVWGFQNGATTGIPMGGKSGVFLTYGTVVPTSSGSILTVTAPKPLARNTIGQSIAIAWTPSMIINRFDVFLDYITNTSSTTFGPIASNLTGDLRNYQWSNTSWLQSHLYYAIRVQGTQNTTNGGGVFTGIVYPLQILGAGVVASTVDVGITAATDVGSGSQITTDATGTLNPTSGALSIGSWINYFVQ